MKIHCWDCCYLPCPCIPSFISRLCSRCQHCISVSYRPAIAHASSPTLGYLDVQGLVCLGSVAAVLQIYIFTSKYPHPLPPNTHRCTPVDLILMQSETTLSCLECGRNNTTSGFNYGEHKDIWCKRCHTKLSIFAEQCRLIQHQPGATLPLPNPAPSKSPKKQKELVIQVGKPLPEFGTCSHYKKSHRWLRSTFYCHNSNCGTHEINVWLYFTDFHAVASHTHVTFAMTWLRIMWWREPTGCCVGSAHVSSPTLLASRVCLVVGRWWEANQGLTGRVEKGAETRVRWAGE